MNRGNLIIYDSKGTIWSQTGEASGDILPHEYPIGIPYIVVPYGSTEGKRIVSVDVTKTPHEVVVEGIEIKPSYEELENKVLLLENEKVEGGIF